MRTYGKVLPQFWTGDTGLEIANLGDKVRLLALYLITCPEASMTGLFHILPSTICERLNYEIKDLRSPFEAPLKDLRRLSGTGFCEYDEQRSVIWVCEMAKFQIGDSISEKDNLRKAIEKEIAPFRKSTVYSGFYVRYRDCFHISSSLQPEGPSKPLPRGSEAPSKPRDGDGTRIGDGDGDGSSASPFPETTPPNEEEEPEGFFSNEEENRKLLPPEPTILTFQCNGDVKEWNLTQSFVDKCREAYPTLDIVGECNRAKLWTDTNGRKTAKGMPKFLNGWFSRANDRGRSGSNGSGGGYYGRDKPIPTPEHLRTKLAID